MKLSETGLLAVQGRKKKKKEGGMCMRRRLAVLLAGVLVLSLFAGCGSAREEEEDKSFLTEYVGTIYKDAESIVSSDHSDTAEPVGTPSTFREAFINGEIENNGAYFVRVGDRVYFRLYGSGSLDPVTVGTDVLSYGTPAGGSRIMYYDTVTHEVVEAFKDDGFGKIYVASDGFWLCRNDARGDEAPDTVLYWVSEDGSETKDHCLGMPVGVSEDGAYVAFLPYDEYGSIEVLSGDADLSMVSPEYGEILTYVGIADDQLIFLCRSNEDYATSRHDLYSMDVVTKELTLLGKIPYEENSFIQDAFLTPERFEAREADVYLLAAQYEGSGHFLQDYIAVHAVAGQENSLNLIAYEEATGDKLPGMTVTDGGARLEPAQPHTAGLSNDVWGSLDFYDSGYSAIKLVPDYISDFTEGSMFRTALQTAEVVGDDVFAIRSLHERSPEDDIGWREAFRLDQLYYERFSWKNLDEDGTTGDLSALGSVLIPEEGVEYIQGTDNPAGSENSQTVNVYVEEGALPGNCEYFDYAAGDPYAMNIVFSPDSTVQEFCLYEITWEQKEEFSQIYHKRELTPDKPLAASVTFPGDVSAYAFSYYLDDGTEKLYRITISGYDGSLLVREIID